MEAPCHMTKEQEIRGRRRRRVWFAYNLVFVFVFMLLLPRFLWRMCKRGGYAKFFLQRMGFFQKELLVELKQNTWHWLHAVSVGEVYVALRLIEELRVCHPEIRCVLTVNTSTGRHVAEKAMHASDRLLYFPVDMTFVIRRILDLVRPRAVILTESELWPNLIRESFERRIPVFVVNGRISDSSYKGYRRLRWFTRHCLPLVHKFFVQSRLDKKRLTSLGALPDSVQVLGSAKYDVAAIEEESVNASRTVFENAGIRSDHITLLGGSTWKGEESVLLEIVGRLRNRFPNVRLILAPRHVERCEQVLKTINAKGLHGIRRTNTTLGELGLELDASSVLLIDTTGELKGLYAHADIIFVGKSLTQHGGQNIIEPAVYGKPIVVGPHMENFPVVTKDFLEAQAIRQVQNKAELEEVIGSLISDRKERDALGVRARILTQEKRGVLKATAEALNLLGVF